MLRLHPLLPLTSVLVLPLALGGCVGALVVGGMAAAGGAGYAAADERGVAGTVDDYTLRTNIENAWQRSNPNYLNAFDVTVYGGRVLLTGEAPSPEIKDNAAAIAQTVPGIRRLYNDIEVSGTPTGWDKTKDAWITAQIRSHLIFEAGVRSDNYKIETADGSVYLMGSARSQNELDKATTVARFVPGVRRVVSYVTIRPGVPPVASEQGPQPLPPEMPGDEPPPGAAPGAPAPIQVQPL